MTDDRVRHDSVAVNGPQVSKHRGHDGSQDPTADCATWSIFPDDCDEAPPYDIYSYAMMRLAVGDE